MKSSAAWWPIASKRRRSCRALSLEELKKFNPAFEKDALSVIDPGESVDSKQVMGGTSRKQVSGVIRKIRGKKNR